MPRLIANDLCIGASAAVSSFRMKQEALRDGFIAAVVGAKLVAA